MNAKEIINELLARFPEPTCREQEDAVKNAKTFLAEMDKANVDYYPRTAAAVRECFQTGIHPKVKASAMNELEMQIEHLKADRERITQVYQHALNQVLNDSERLDWIQSQADVVIMGTPLSGNIRIAIDAARKGTKP